MAGNTNPIQLLNPIASHLSVMRSSLIGSLMQVLRFNLDRRLSRVRVFELGRVFLKDESVQDTDSSVKGFAQPMRVAGLAYGSAQSLQWGVAETSVDFYDVKGDVEALLAPYKPRFTVAEHPALHPGRCAQVWIGEQAIGFVGELHPKWRQSYDLPKAPVLFELDLQAVLQRPIPSPQAVSKFPTVLRDLALMVPNGVTHDDLVSTIQEAAKQEQWLKDVVLFDVYRSATDPAQEPSFAMRLSLNKEDATLLDTEVEALIQTIVQHLADKLKVRLRV